MGTINSHSKQGIMLSLSSQQSTGTVEKQSSSVELKDISVHTPTHSQSEGTDGSKTPSESDMLGGQDPLVKETTQPTSERINAAIRAIPQVIIFPVLIGMAFGIALQRGRVHEFFYVRQQMTWRYHVMLKMFLAAAATSIATIALIRAFGNRRLTRNLHTTSSWMTSHPGRGLPSILLGTFLVGVGMPISGSCPGTVFSQIGAGSTKAWFVIIGGVLGGTLFYMAESNIPAVRDFLAYKKLLGPKARLDTLTGLNYYVVAGAFVVALVGLVIMFELMFPWKEELEALIPRDETNWDDALPGGIAGSMIGILQLPLIAILSNHLGCSSSYCTAASNVLFFVKGSNEWQLVRANWWQVFLVTGMALGSFTSAALSGASFRSDDTVSIAECLLGGATMVIGARLAAGCTSGHGISGMGYLSTASLLGTASMFGAGLATGFIFYR